jgi:acyl-coenzyme A synthetase/AMP-(fatty) acid ligase
MPSAFGATAQFLAWHARRTPHATAIVEDGSQKSYHDLATDLVRCVWALAELPVRPGMLIGVETSQRYLHLLLLLACEVIGARTVSLIARELSVDDALAQQSDVLLTDSEPWPHLLTKRTKVDAAWLQDRGATRVGTADLAILDRHVPPEQPIRIVKSSGTTGRPKTMQMSYARQQLIVARNMDGVAEDAAWRPTFLCLYNLAMRACHLRVLGTLQHGGTVYFAREEDVPVLIAGRAVNYALFVVADAERMSRREAKAPRGHLLQAEVIGAAVNGRLRRQIAEGMNVRVIHKYSSNETNRIAMIGEDGVGVLCRGAEARIVDQSGHDLPFGQTGMVRVKTETMLDGYYNEPELTAAAFIDGWYQTNDIGFMPGPGRLVVLGRADDLLNIGGIKIVPGPLEDEIRQIDGITDAAVMQIDSPMGLGTLLVAVELASDQTPSELAVRISDIVSRYTRTCEIMPLPWFPRTESGKVKRQEIKAAFRRREAAFGSALSRSG